MSRFLPSRIQRNFGLKATLNAVYADGIPDDETNRIRSVTAKTVFHNTLHTKRQTDADALFEAFGVDAGTDFLKKVSGKPFDENLGSIMTGADSVTVLTNESIHGLDQLCLQLQGFSAGDEYKEQFEWIDKIKSVTDEQLRNDLLQLVASLIRKETVEELALTIPKILKPNFMAALDKEIKSIDESTADLPPSPGDKPEGEYNEDAANHSNEHLLLDKKSVRIPSKTSPIEICDVLTADKKMIHVKRKLSSSSLSHLFSQGFVSGDLLVTSAEYRDACVKKIDAAA